MRMNHNHRPLTLGILALQLAATTQAQAEALTNLVSVEQIRATGTTTIPWPHYRVTLNGQAWEGSVTNATGVSTPSRYQVFNVGEVYTGRTEIIPTPLPDIPNMGMFNTGVDPDGVGQSSGYPENHWAYTNAYLTPIDAYVVAPGYSPYYLPSTALANNDTSAWIRGGSEGSFSLSFTIPNATMANSMILNLRAAAGGYYPNFSYCDINGSGVLQTNPSAGGGWSVPSDMPNDRWSYFVSTNLVSGANRVRFSLGGGFGGTNYVRVEFLPFSYRQGVTPSPGAFVSPAHLNMSLPDCHQLYINGKPANLNPNLAHATWTATSSDFTFEIRPATNTIPAVQWTAIGRDGTETEMTPKENGHYLLPADDGKTKATAKLLNGYTFEDVTFSIDGEFLGSAITPYGVLIPGKKPGTIKVVATGIDTPCINTTFYFDLDSCATCASGDCAKFGGVATGNEHPQGSVRAGGSETIGSAGHLAIESELPSALLGTPESLEYNFIRPDVDVIRDNGIIAQLKAADGLVVVSTNSASSYSLLFFPTAQVGAKDNERYTYSGDPSKTVTLENVGGDINHFRVSDSERGAIADYHWQTNGWTVVTGNGLRKDVRTETLAGDIKTVAVQTLNTADIVERESLEVWQVTTNGDLLLLSVDGDGSNARTNTYSYNDAGQLLETHRAAGSWEILRYDSQGRQTNRFTPFLNSAPTTNSADCRLTVYEYGTNSIAGSDDTGMILPNTPRCTIQYVQGNEVSRQYTIVLDAVRKNIVCIQPGAAWDSTNNLVTTTWLSADAASYGKPIQVFHPNGTVEVFDEDTTTVNGTTYERESHTAGALDTAGDFAEGTREDAYKDPATKTRRIRSVYDLVSQQFTETEYYFYDAAGHLTNTVYLDGTQTLQQYDCCHLASTTDRRGITTSYGHDALSRVITTTRDGITTSNVLNSVGDVLQTYRIGTNGATTLQGESGYDTGGQLLWQNNARGQTTTFTNYTDAAGQSVHVTSFVTITNAETMARDGSTISSLGNAGQQIRYEYGTEVVDDMRQSYVLTIPLDVDGTNTTEWKKSYTDAAGRPTKAVYPNGSETKTYNAKGQLTKETDRDGVQVLYAYNALGQLESRALDANRNGIIDPAGPDRVTQTKSDVAFHGTNVVRRALSFAYTDATTNATLVSRQETAVDAQIAWAFAGNGTNQTETILTGDGTWATVDTEANGTVTTRTYAGDRLLSLLVTDPTVTLKSETYAYDEFNRLFQTTDARNGVTTYGYGDADLLVSVTAPPPAEGQPAPVTTRIFDEFGRVQATQFPDGTWTTNEYFLNGTLKKTYGSRTYPVEYTYDFAGRIKTMTTWGAAGPATTTWNYDSNGRLQGKAYADNQGPSFTYTDAGRLMTRTWARGITTPNTYNLAGDLVGISYTDGTTPVSIGYDRQGRPNSISGTTTNWMTYSVHGQPLVENAGSVAMNYFSELNRGYDEFGRFASISNGLIGYSVALANSGRRITGISNGLAATYGYVTNSPLLATSTVQGSGSLVTSREYDHLNRLQSITAGASGLAASYEYNTANQRTALTNADGSFWAFGYDDLGQVTNANRHFADGELVSGQQFAFSYDAIGNRSYTSVGGNADGTGMRQAQYGVNGINQYTNREVPGFIEVSGTATGAVSVNGAAPTWQGDYFRSELAVDNSADSVFTNTIITASDATSTSLVARSSFVPRTPESFTYDLDGNLTQDGQWAYTWDAENRLIQMESLTNAVPVEHRLQLTVTYDWQGRRIAKLVKQWNPETGTYQITSFRKFHYDGWNLICEQDEVTGMKISYTWGLDISQSLQGAGGVGGLLWMTVQAGPLAGTYSVQYDGNGNVIGLVSATDGSVVAHYEYGPFGELLRATGPMAGLMPFRFSTKYQDVETELVYYGYRYYRVDVGRWINKDPIGEAGGPNVYGFVANSPVNAGDLLGLVLCAFDGTGNDSATDAWRDENSDKNAPTNVEIMQQLYDGWRIYQWGVGTRTDKFTGKLFGMGIHDRLERMLNLLKEYRERGTREQSDPIDIIGFSRGAASARIFVNMLKKELPCAKIRFMGLFDTVAQIGAPNRFNYQPGYDLSVDASRIGYVAHAVAKNEYRSLFPLTSISSSYRTSHIINLVSGVNLITYAPDEVVEIKGANYWEKPFDGAHSDLGGGYQNGRNVRALQWILEQAQRASAPFRNLDSYADIWHLTENLHPHDSRYLVLDKVPGTSWGANTRVVFPGNL